MPTQIRPYINNYYINYSVLQCFFINHCIREFGIGPWFKKMLSRREDRETCSTCISSSYGTSKSKNTKGGFERQFADVGFGKLSALTHRHRGNTELRVRPAEPQVWLQRPALPMMQGGSWMTEQERNAGCSHLHGFCTHPEEREHPAAALSGRG